MTYNGSDGQAVENHVESLPELQTVAALAFIVEPDNVPQIEQYKSYGA